MALPSDVPELKQDHAALGVNGVGYFPPAFDLRIAIDAGRAEITAALDRNRSGFGNLQAAFGSALAVILHHHGARHVAGLIGTQPRQRRLDDTMVQTDSSDLEGGIKFGHSPLLLFSGMLRGRRRRPPGW